MHNIATSQDPLVLLMAVVFGTAPALLWLRFWMREDVKPEPRGLIALTFIAGMIAVILVLPIQKWIQANFTDQKTLITLWAAAEELLKYIAVSVIAFRASGEREPVDFPIYLIAGALGFSALENALFIFHPLSVQDASVTFLTSNLRFLGSTLLHATATGFIGLMMGLSFFSSKTTRVISVILGFGIGISLHATFNFFIMQKDGENFLQVFAFLWIVTIINMLVFEKLRRMSMSVSETEN